MSDYNLEVNEAQVLVLSRGGMDLLCPWQESEVVCGSWCSLFRIRESSQGIAIKQECGPTGEIFIIADE